MKKQKKQIAIYCPIVMTYSGSISSENYQGPTVIKKENKDDWDEILDIIGEDLLNDIVDEIEKKIVSCE